MHISGLATNRGLQGLLDIIGGVLVFDGHRGFCNSADVLDGMESFSSLHLGDLKAVRLKGSG